MRILPALLLGMVFLAAPSVSAKRYRLSRWGIPKANYSGITHLGGHRYAVVSDEEPMAGFYVWTLRMDSVSGKVLEVANEGFRGIPRTPDRDTEGIAFCPQRNSIFVSGETDQRILEHRPDGTLTGAKLRIPPQFAADKILHNRGFEALTYDARSRLFWTCTESPLPTDEALHLRMLCFSADLNPAGEYPYRLDTPRARNAGRDYYHGVVALAPLGDGRLLVLEREARIAKHYSGSRCWCKLFVYSPAEGRKRLLESWDTRMNLWNTRFSNYEGMCLGPTLADGTRTLLLLADSQAGAGRGPWRLKDRLMVLRLETTL